ncbi:hypothetical protein SISNIDRAFT_312602 [Sistotremastrum niveocremeum HHB9708]|uniref:Uncharacterized protein n=1 Tax=Sistotremastrum niveocremeum HHB9708 TaxID=1314777 RepID=A0A164XXE0_9AGAM|nr:hypothetical protein SISNIDRAFT_312602 [Sistotremastrum niveocremeum HHB9708]
MLASPSPMYRTTTPTMEDVPKRSSRGWHVDREEERRRDAVARIHELCAQIEGRNTQVQSLKIITQSDSLAVKQSFPTTQHTMPQARQDVMTWVANSLEMRHAQNSIRAGDLADMEKVLDQDQRATRRRSPLRNLLSRSSDVSQEDRRQPEDQLDTLQELLTQSRSASRQMPRQSLPVSPTCQTPISYAEQSRRSSYQPPRQAYFCLRPLNRDCLFIEQPYTGIDGIQMNPKGQIISGYLDSLIECLVRDPGQPFLKVVITTLGPLMRSYDQTRSSAKPS